METKKIEEVVKSLEDAKKEAQPQMEKLNALKAQLQEALKIEWVKPHTINDMPVEVSMMNRGIINIACRDKDEANKILNILLPLLNK